MAMRPVFAVHEGFPFYHREDVSFTFHPGFSLSQAQQSVISLHKAYKEKCPGVNVIEISTKSTTLLGSKLSAFNLMYRFDDGHEFPIENVFQSGKCFRDGARFPDLLYGTPYDAKKDERIRLHGDVAYFVLGETIFPNSPATFFYDWLYINALNQHPALAEQLMQYSAFTDIAFNPQKSINCQAKAAAIFVSLSRANTLNSALRSPVAFRQIVYDSLDTTPLLASQMEQLSFL